MTIRCTTLVLGAVLTLGAAAPAAARSSDAGFVGARACGTCHPEAYEVWSASKHAVAHQAMSGRHARDRTCAQCHSMSIDGERLVGVQCESCHGPGAYYVKPYVMRDKELARLVGLTDVAAETCARCHTDDSPAVRSFDPVERWAVIAHGKD